MSQDADTSTGEQPTNASPGEDRGLRVRSLDTIFELLVSSRRRSALYVLYQADGPVALSDLVAEVASMEDAVPERVGIALHQVHLPKLADAEVVDYDVEAETVRLVTLSERFRRYLTTAAADEERPLRGSNENATTSGT